MKRYIIANTDNLPDDTFSGDRDTRAQLAKKTTDPDVMLVLAYDPDSLVRNYLAVNPNISSDILGILCDDQDDYSQVGNAVEAQEIYRYSHKR